MIVVKLELWPGGNEERAREIGRTYIANVGGTQDRGDYRVAVCRRGSSERPLELYLDHPRDVLNRQLGRPHATRTGRVDDYPRLSYNVWRLIIRALRSCFPEEG